MASLKTLLAAVAMTAAAAAGPGPSRAATLSTDAASRACPADSDAALAGFRCARLRVPLDYGRPRARQIVLAVVKHRATGRSARSRTLFMNPGGPGGTGTEQIPDWYRL